MSPHRFATAAAVASMLLAVASAATSYSVDQDKAPGYTPPSGIEWIPSPTATVAAPAMSTIGCFESSTPLKNHGLGYFNSEGSCQQICLGLKKKVMGLSEGTDCWCGDKIPQKSAKVDDKKCATPCKGIDTDKCGGPDLWWIQLTGNTLNPVEYYDPEEDASSSSSASKTAAPSSSTAAATTTPASAAQSPTEAANEKEEEEEDKGPNKAGIAAGVVVGVVALLAIIGGVVYWLRQKRRREVEEEYRRQAANVNSFVAGGKPHTSNSSMTDSRLDPEFMNRRQSNGSIADNEDYSRRILKVTNA